MDRQKSSRLPRAMETHPRFLQDSVRAEPKGAGLGILTHLRHKPKSPPLNTPGKPAPGKWPSCSKAPPKPVFFWEKGLQHCRGGWGPQQDHWTQATQFPLQRYMRLLIPPACSSRPCLITPQMLAPKANVSYCSTQSLTAQLGCDQPAQERTHAVLLVCDPPAPLVWKG